MSHLARRAFGARLIPAVVAAILLSGTQPLTADDWPQWLGPNRDGVWREKGILDHFPADGPQVRWRRPVAAGYTGPAVAQGRVYLIDRTAQTEADGTPIADKEGRLPGNERVLCLSAATGESIWEHAYDCPYKISYPVGPRSTPTVDGDHVYTLGAMGDLLCLATADGAIRWSMNLAEKYKTPPPVWGWAAHPLVDGEKLITLAGGEGTAVVALNKNTGEELWRSLTAQEVGYAPPVIYEFGGKRQLVIWLDTALYGLNPETGEQLWSIAYPQQGEPMRPTVTIAMPRQDGERLLISGYYNGSMMVEVADNPPRADLIWGAPVNDRLHIRGLNSLMVTPTIDKQHIYGISGTGELRCLKADTGEVVWREIAVTGTRRQAFATCFLVQHEDRYFLFNDQGDLIVARLTAERYQELGRANLLAPTQEGRGREVIWSHPAFADRAVFARNDKELVCVELAADPGKTS